MTDELSWRERNHIYKMCSIPMMLVFFAFLIYFNYLMYNNALGTRWVLLSNVILPFLILFPTTGIIAYELLYRRKIKKPLILHLKRFGGRMFVLSVSLLWLVGFSELAQPLFSSLVGETGLLLSSVLALVVYVLAVIRLRETINKIDRGDW